MLLIPEGWISLYGFTIGGSILLFHLLSSTQNIFTSLVFFIGHLLGSSLIIPRVISLSAFHKEIFQVGAFLGWGCSIGLCLFIDSFSNFGVYLIFLTLFHFTEFFVTAISNPKNLSFDSYLINHGKEYGCALLVSWIEYFIELYFFGKSFGIISFFGVIICFVGDVIRKTAMIHAGPSFNHIVQNDRKGDHVLITGGIYAYSRHPSYVGWFLWSTGTQIILLNPICLIAYIVVTWKFFNQRIYYEEYTLLNFFGTSYKEYMERVPVGIPFIKGFLIKED